MKMGPRWRHTGGILGDGATEMLRGRDMPPFYNTLVRPRIIAVIALGDQPQPGIHEQMTLIALMTRVSENVNCARVSPRAEPSLADGSVRRPMQWRECWDCYARGGKRMYRCTGTGAAMSPMWYICSILRALIRRRTPPERNTLML